MNECLNGMTQSKTPSTAAAVEQPPQRQQHTLAIIIIIEASEMKHEQSAKLISIQVTPIV